MEEGWKWDVVGVELGGTQLWKAESLADTQWYVRRRRETIPSHQRTSQGWGGGRKS